MMKLKTVFIFCCSLAIILWVFTLTAPETYNNWLTAVHSSHIGADFLHYYVLPSEMNLNSPKIIFLWTTYFGDYQHWTWGIGPTPRISDCRDIVKRNQSCIVTTHGDMLEQADVVLFALQDIRQVRKIVHGASKHR